jgi:hypothetical protein
VSKDNNQLLYVISVNGEVTWSSFKQSVSKNTDQLFYIISAKNEMSWASFKEAFDYLYTLQADSIDGERDGIKPKRFQTVRALDALGHCDFDFNENKVYAAPPVLVRLPCAGFPQAILAGARSPQTIQKLSEACKAIGNHVNLEVTEQPGELVLVPRRVAVQAEEVGELEAIANFLEISFLEMPSAWSLAHFAASIDDYLTTFQWSNDPELTTWKRQTFDPSSLQFRSSQERDTDIRLSQYSHPSRNSQKHYLWKEGRCTEIDRDWGRYVVLKALRRNVLVYDQQRFIIAVPVGAKLPRLLERALTLCSGYVATFVEGLPFSPEIRGFNLFRAIPPQIAEMTAKKLGQTLSTHSLDIQF